MTLQKIFYTKLTELWERLVVTIYCSESTFTHIEAIVFDKDGTLADVESFLTRLGKTRSQLINAQVPGTQARILSAFGLESTHLNPAGLLAVGSRYENKIAAATYIAETGRSWSEALEMVEAAFNQADTHVQSKADHTPLFPGTFDMLTTLSQAGLKLGILSADSSANVQDFLATYHLQDLFQAAHGVDGTVSKPDPTLFSNICAQLGTAPGQTLMIGDAAVDMKMAKSADAAGCIFVNWGGPSQAPAQYTDITLENWQQLTLSP